MLQKSHAAEFDIYINLQWPVGRETPDLKLFSMGNIHLLWREIKHLLKITGEQRSSHCDFLSHIFTLFNF